jgi:hypothetical protein
LVVPFGHQRLHLDRALDGPYNARKLKHETIAGVLHDPAAVIENDWALNAPGSALVQRRTFGLGG